MALCVRVAAGFVLDDVGLGEDRIGHGPVVAEVFEGELADLEGDGHEVIDGDGGGIASVEDIGGEESGGASDGEVICAELEERAGGLLHEGWR